MKPAINNSSIRMWLSVLARRLGMLLVCLIGVVSTGGGGLLLPAQVEAQCPAGTMTTFERVSSVAVRSDTMLSLLYTAPNSTSQSILNQMSATGDLVPSPHQRLQQQQQQQQQQPGAIHAQQVNGAALVQHGVPITAECNNRCRRMAKCRAFLVDYARHTCYSIEHQAGSSGLGLGPGRSMGPIQLVASQERTSFFEKICLAPPSQECERAWFFERVPGHQLMGHDDKTIEDVAGRQRCQELCLSERDFRCRSAEYDSFAMQCRLSSSDRHTKSSSFRPAPSSVEYFENQCALPSAAQCDTNTFERFEELDLGRAEIMRSANSSDQCQHFCTHTIKAFVCRSFTWSPSTGKCYLNSANTLMVGGVERLISAPGLIYFQRGDCIDLKLECDTTAMTLNLRTNEPFRGRMYVRDEPGSCEYQGRSALLSSLSIPFQSHARCATREPPNRYSSVVVVQQHPMIQRKSDKYIKLVCDFETANKTITSHYNVATSPWASTALINATSFAPKVILRITDRYGLDTTGARLGDELYMRIETETDSVYDMVARSVLAKSGTSEESIVLIDKDGCPTDFRIFPAMRKLNRRTIIGKFDAFRFSSDVVVRFQADVSFCLNQCPPSSCETNLLLNAQPGDQFEMPAAAGHQQQQQQLPSPLPLSTMSPLAGSSLPDSSLVVAALGGSSSPVPLPAPTGAPPMMMSSSAPYLGPQQQLPNQLGRRAPTNFSVSSSSSSSSGLPPNHHNSPYSTGSHHQFAAAANPEPTNQDPFYYGSRPAANQPMGHSTMLAGSNPFNGSTMLEVPTSDPQIFEHTERLNGSREGAAGGATTSMRAARRRRSAEPLPTSPRHVSLQREIIVESGPVASNSNANGGYSSSTNGHRESRANDPATGRPRSHQRAKSASGRKPSAATRNPGPYYDVNGNKVDMDIGESPLALNGGDEQAPADNIVCTTGNSLVIATVIFCVFQLLVICMCSLTWMHRTDGKFKVQHPVPERLY